VVKGNVSGDFQGFAGANNLFDTNFASSDLAFSTVGQSKSFKADGGTYGFSPDGNPYSLSIFINYTLDGGATIAGTSGNAQTSPTPAPAGFALVIAGLPVLGFACLRRRRQVLAV
jgi:hypothetical protein